MAAPKETEEELNLIKDCIIFPLVLNVLERDIKAINGASLKIPEFYTSLISRLQGEIAVSMVQNRMLVRKHGMKIIEQNRTTEGIETKYICRGYQSVIFMTWRHVRAEIKDILLGFAGLDITIDQEA